MRRHIPGQHVQQPPITNVRLVGDLVGSLQRDGAAAGVQQPWTDGRHEYYHQSVDEN